MIGEGGRDEHDPLLTALARGHVDTGEAAGAHRDRRRGAGPVHRPVGAGLEGDPGGAHRGVLDGRAGLIDDDDAGALGGGERRT